MQKIMEIGQDRISEMDRHIDRHTDEMPNYRPKTETAAILCLFVCVSSLTHSVEAAPFVESSGDGIALVLGHQGVFPVDGQVDVFPHQSVGG